MDIRAGTAAMREKRLYEAALSGSVESLHELMREDKLTLARVSLTCFNETHLHIAAMLGHADFVKALLSYSSSDLVMTKLDEHGRTPMHLASGAGRVEVVRLLVAADADVCLVQDEDGRTPLHLAAMHGHLDVVRELIKARPQVVSTRYMLERGATILHTCVVHNRLEVLKVLMSMVTMDDDFLNFKDDNGYTILHTSAALKHKEIIRYLVSEGSRVRVDAKNENGFTALDMMDHMPRDLKTMEIIDLLVKAGAGRRDHQETRTTEPAPNRINSTPFDFFKNMWKDNDGKSMWSKKMREGIMVAATLIAGIAYQATISPPGGVWQAYTDLEMWDHHSNRRRNATVVPGTSVMGIYYPSSYALFWALNTVSFGTAISVIFLLVSGIHFRRGRFATWSLIICMWLTITSMGLCYIISFLATTADTIDLNPVDPSDLPSYVDPKTGSDMNFYRYVKIIVYPLIGWMGCFCLVVVVHVCRFIWRIITTVAQFIWWIITIVAQYMQSKMPKMSSHDDEMMNV